MALEREGDFMVPENVRQRQGQILKLLEEIALQGRTNTTELSLMRVELGTGPNAHGRLPVLEGCVAKLAREHEALGVRVGRLETTGDQNLGGQNARQRIWNLVSGLAGGAIALAADWYKSHR